MICVLTCPFQESSSAGVSEDHVLSVEGKKHTGESLLLSVLMISANMVTLFRIRIEYRIFLCLLTVKSPRRLVLFAHGVPGLWCGKRFASYSHFYQIHIRKSSSSREIYEGWNFNSGNYLFTTDTK